MSGGFFRGTTADQDTRFSNKQAKLMKSQKFAPELEHLVDMTKVKMDVLRPWIAKRVTELLGFEDEVLINFIYGLLDGKNVNGKEIQIAITGFMEKNTGKFMKELWTLLLSAQKNASGVPQQFLDEKEEETKRKMADAERITNEIQRKKEREADESGLGQKKLEGGPDPSRSTATDDKLFPKHRNRREPSNSNSHDNREEVVGRNGRDRKARFERSRSSPSTESLPRRRMSMSRSPRARKRSISSDRERHNRKRSITPHYSASSRRSPSLLRRRSSYRQRSRSRSYSRSSSPRQFRSFRQRSPHDRRRRSPSPVRRRSPGPVHRRSPSRRSRRSPSLVHRRSPSHVRRRSPLHKSRSPAIRGSRQFVRHQSDSPVHERSPLRRARRGSTSSPSHGTSPSARHTSPSLRGHRSPSPRGHRLSSLRRQRTPSPAVRHRHNQQSLSNRHRRASPESHQPLASDSIKGRSPSDSRAHSSDRSVTNSPIHQRSLLPSRENSPDSTRNPIAVSSIETHSSPKSRLGRKSLGNKSTDPNEEVPLKVASMEKPVLSCESPANPNGYPADELRSGRKESKISIGNPPQVTKELNSAQGDSEKRDKYSGKANNAKDFYIEKEDGFQHLMQENVRVGKGAGGDSSDSGYVDDKKRKRKGSSSRHEVSSEDDSSDLDEDEKKDDKRRRKEEKRLRRKERHQRHEEKRRKKEEKHSEKHKSRKDDDLSIEKKITDKFDVDEEKEKKKLEIELRKKALESLKAKKGVGR